MFPTFRCVAESVANTNYFFVVMATLMRCTNHRKNGLLKSCCSFVAWEFSNAPSYSTKEIAIKIIKITTYADTQRSHARTN